MRPVNLLPEESRSGGGPTGDPLVSYGIIGALALLLVMVLYTILLSNQATTAQDEADELRARAGKYQVKAEPVQEFNDFGAEVDKRTLLIAGLAGRRFPWHDALFNLSRVVPQDVTIDTIKASTAATTAESADAAAGDASGNVEEGPGATIELTGCVKDWIAYARYMSRLETMPGVSRVGVKTGGDDSGEEGGESDSGSPSGTDDDALRHKNCGAEPLQFTLAVDYKRVPIDVIGLPKAAPAGGGASGATGPAPSATPATPSADAAMGVR